MSKCRILEHPLYNTDLYPCDFHIFGSLRKAFWVWQNYSISNRRSSKSMVYIGKYKIFISWFYWDCRRFYYNLKTHSEAGHFHYLDDAIFYISISFISSNVHTLSNCCNSLHQLQNRRQWTPRSCRCIFLVSTYLPQFTYSTCNYAKPTNCRSV